MSLLLTAGAAPGGGVGVSPLQAAAARWGIASQSGLCLGLHVMDLPGSVLHAPPWMAPLSLCLTRTWHLPLQSQSHLMSLPRCLGVILNAPSQTPHPECGVSLQALCPCPAQSLHHCPPEGSEEAGAARGSIPCGEQSQLQRPWGRSAPEKKSIP